MAKKPKEPKNNGDSTPSPASPSSNIFKTLFGDTPLLDTTSASMFSDDNPFRRKPTDPSQPKQHQLGLGFQENGNPNSQNIDAGVVKKRKRNKDKVRSIDSDSAGEDLEIKKSKKGSDSKEILNEEDSTNTSLEIEKNGDEKEKKKKKEKRKRKRDELEAEYEAKKYGVVALKDESKEGPVVGEKRKTLDQPEDMFVSNEGFDDEDKLLRTVFVGNLPVKVKKKALLKEFSQFGEVESVRIRSVPIINSKTPRKGAIIKKQINDSVDSVHAYIVFKTEESVQASLSHNMAVFGGNHIRVDRACPPRKKLKGEENALLYDNKRTVFVGNLPFDVKDEEIIRLFSGINNLESSIEAVRVVRDPGTSVGKGIAYVLFKTREAANLVLKKRNLKIRDRDLRLYHAKSNANTTPSSSKKRENPNSSFDRYNSRSKKLAGSSEGQNKMKTIASSGSYQGLRASKSGIQKKVSTRISESMKVKPNTPKTPKLKERIGKRPAVAARRANAMNGNGSGDSKQAGKKRKPVGRTPESSHRNKKPRKFR
ncbi:hypothetical protein LguiA_015350 [Lonicera macranthoides]